MPRTDKRQNPMARVGYNAEFLRESAQLTRQMDGEVEDAEARELLLSAAERFEVLALGLEMSGNEP